jgi:hypothetical protein
MSESLDQLLKDLTAIDRFLEVETFIGKLSTKQMPDGFETLRSNGLDDREFALLITNGLSIAKGARAELPVVTGTLVLYLAGRFESFVKEKIEGAARDIGNKCGQFDRLPEKMRSSLLNQTVEVIKNPRKFGHAENGVRSFVKRLAAGYTSITEAEPVNFECISITESNMRPDVFKEICDRIGFTDAWTHLSTQSNMKLFFGSLDPSTVSRDAQSLLKKIMDDRNSIAHPASSTTFPNAATVSRYVSFIKVLCTEFESVLDMYVAVLQPV